jgi:hypothetical protein
VGRGSRQFGKKGELGYGAGDSFQIRVKQKESPNGISMHPEPMSYASA